MTDNDKKPTLEEIATRDLKDEFYQTVVGSNRGQDVSLYGALGKQGAEAAYEVLMNGDRVRKMIDGDYQTRLQIGKNRGLVGQPNRLTPYDVSFKIAEQIEQDKAILTLGELEGIVKGIDDGFEFVVPKKLRGMKFYKLREKLAEKKSKGMDPSEQEVDAINSYQILTKAYDRAVTFKAIKAGDFADLNEAGREISERYEPKKKAA